MIDHQECVSMVIGMVEWILCRLLCSMFHGSIGAGFIVSFALIDTNLYLDTHPNDKKAMDHFNQYQKARKQALKEYARNFEPLTIDSADIDEHFTWATDSWPWMKRGGC